MPLPKVFAWALSGPVVACVTSRVISSPKYSLQLYSILSLSVIRLPWLSKTKLLRLEVVPPARLLIFLCRLKVLCFSSTVSISHLSSFCSNCSFASLICLLILLFTFLYALSHLLLCFRCSSVGFNISSVYKNADIFYFAPGII